MKKRRKGNEYGVTYDKPGFCALCHVPIAEFNGSTAEGEFIIKRLLPNCSRALLTMNNGSTLVVTLCNECNEGMEPKDIGELTESVFEGWQASMDPRWTKEAKQKELEDKTQYRLLNRADYPWTEEECKKVSQPRAEKMKVRS